MRKTLIAIAAAATVAGPAITSPAQAWCFWGCDSGVGAPAAGPAPRIRGALAAGGRICPGLAARYDHLSGVHRSLPEHGMPRRLLGPQTDIQCGRTVGRLLATTVYVPAVVLRRRPLRSPYLDRQNSPRSRRRSVPRQFAAPL